MAVARQPEPRKVAIVGGGIVGLCLAETLDRQGTSFWCFEQGAVGAGQSGGVTRIFRHRHDDPRLVSLALEGRSSWRAMEERLGRELVGPEGVLMLDNDSGLASRLQELGIGIETPDWSAAKECMSMGELPSALLRPVFDIDGGAIRAEVAVSALAEVVVDSMVQAEVHALAEHRSGVSVLASSGTWEVDEVFVTAGEGTAPLASSAGIRIPQQRLAHLRLTFESKPMPCLLDRSSCFGEIAYGSPTPDGHGYAIGLSGDDGSVPLAGSARPDAAALSRLRDRIEAYASKLSSEGLGDVIGARLCVATPLDSGDDDFHAWRKGRVTYFAGHNLFKFAPLIGALLAGSTEARDLPGELLLPSAGKRSSPRQ